MNVKRVPHLIRIKETCTTAEFRGKLLRFNARVTVSDLSEQPMMQSISLRTGLGQLATWALQSPSLRITGDDGALSSYLSQYVLKLGEPGAILLQMTPQKDCLCANAYLNLQSSAHEVCELEAITPRTSIASSNTMTIENRFQQR